MPIWRLQTAIGSDTAFPRDKLVLTPHFNDSGVGSDPQSLCEDLAAAMHTFFSSNGTRQIEVTAYDAEGTVPVEPQGYAIANPSAFPASNCPREVALCLSFYGGVNTPRRRGRVYVPVGCISGNDLTARPTTTHQDRVASLAPIYQDLGGPDVDWVVWSRTTQTAHTVTDWWVDNEWDTIRSRGMRPTSRVIGTTSEG